MRHRISSADVRRSGVFASLLAVALTVGCDRCTSRATDAAVPTEPPARNAGNVGTVVGVVRLLPGAIVPRYTPEQLGRTTETPGTSERCPPPRDSDTMPVRGSGDPIALAGVAVYATGDSIEAFAAALPTSTPVEHHVAIRECILEPRLVVGAVGDSLVIENQSNDAFFPHVGPSRYMESLMPRGTRRVELDHIDVAPILCGFSLACGRSDVMVMRYPVYTISESAGRFELRNVPADQPLKIHAWHPLFLENTVEARVTRGGRTTVELVLTPLSRYAREGQPTPPRPTPAPTPTPQGTAPTIQ